MRILFALLLWTLSVTNGATQGADSTRLSIQWGTDSEDLNDILTYSRMDFYKVAISDKKVAGKILQFRVREFYNGVETRNTDPFATMSKERFRISNRPEDWVFKFICDKSKPDSVSFFLRFPTVSIPRKYSTLSSKMYSLRNATSLVGKDGHVPLNKPFPLFVYSLPYADPKDPGFYYLCPLTEDGIPPEKWGKHFGVMHYIIWELSIVDDKLGR